MMWNSNDMLSELLTVNPVLALPVGLGLACTVFQLIGYFCEEALLSFIVAHPGLAFMLTCLIVSLCICLLWKLSSEKMQDMPHDAKDMQDCAKLQWSQVRGTYQTQGTPTGRNLQACKRDFARGTAADPCDVFMVTTSLIAPTPWSTLTNIDKGLEDDYDESVFAELDTWLRHHVKEPTAGLTERCIALLVSSNLIDFAKKQQSPMLMTQPKFVLLVSAKNEVRVLWFAFMSDAKRLKEGLLGEPFMVKMMSEDLNSMQAQLKAHTQGVTFDFVTARTIEKNMALYVQEKMSADFRRAVVEDDCQDLL